MSNYDDNEFYNEYDCRMEGGYDYDAGMSNRAVSAYANGEMPISKWTKKEILERFADKGVNNNLIAMLRKVSLKTLRKKALSVSSWHHTSGCYNHTDFYDVSDFTAKNLDAETIAGWIAESAENTHESDGKIGILHWMEWSEEYYGRYGKKRYTRIYHDDEGIIKTVGSYYYLLDKESKKVLLKKKINGKHTWCEYFHKKN